MTDKEILRAVRAFKKGMLAGRSDKKKCFKVCFPLQSFLSVCKVPCWMQEGEIEQETKTEIVVWEHWWIKFPDGRVLDPTASQFKAPDGSKMPDIYLGKKPRWYKEIKPKK